jgi:hypothetical protein
MMNNMCRPKEPVVMGYPVRPVTEEVEDDVAGYESPPIE